MKYSEFGGIRIKGMIGVSPVGDDTKLIAKVASKIKCQSMLDIGTGTGFIPIYLSNLGRKCTGLDINEYAISCAKENARINNVDCVFIRTDLFKKVKGKFDLITFNPPFGNSRSQKITKFLEIIKSLVPKDNNLIIVISYWLIKKSRQKLIERFLRSVRKFLLKNGQVLILLYPPEMHLIRNFPHQIVGRYKDFSLVALQF